MANAINVSYQTPFVLPNLRVAPEWLRLLNQLRLSSDTTADNAAAIAALERDIGQTNANVAALTGRMVAAEQNIAVLQSSVGALEGQVGGLQIRVNQNSLAITNLEAEVEALATYKTVWPIKSVSADYSVVYADFTIEADCTAGDIVITLPAGAAAVTGEFHNVTKVDSSAHTLTLDGAGALVDGFDQVLVTDPDTNLQIQYDGAAWRIL